MATAFHARGVVPEIDTDRLSLRGHCIEDLADSVALWGDPVVTRFIGGKRMSEEEVWTRLLRYIGHWTALGYGYWVIRERVTGRFIGEAGFADYKREISPSLAGRPEAGWVLTPSTHGRGFATEAVRAIVAWGERHFRGAQTVCIINPDNLASIRVAEKVGYVEEARTTYHGAAVIIFAR